MVTQHLKHTLVIILVMTLTLFVLSTKASTIISEDGNNSFKSANSSDSLVADQFIVSSANDAYISYNSFSDFVVDQPLQIFNLPSAGKLAADLVVIHADKVTLQSSIEVIGPKTDILIIERYGNGSTGNGELYCTNCEFSNVNRITLSVLNTSHENFSSEMSAVGEFATTGTGSIILDNVYAPSSFSFETVSSHVENSGVINLNQGLNDTGIGVYHSDLNGNKTVGTGSVNLYLGQYKWNYEEQKITSVIDLPGSALTLEGRIEAPSIRIFSTYPLTVSTNIDTRTDLLATTMYRGVLKIVGENVTIATLKTTAALTLLGNIDTEGSVNLDSAEDMSISAYSDIDSVETHLVVANTLYNFGELSSEVVTVSSGAIANEGKLLATSQANIKAVDYIFNQYGGVIQSDEILLTSESGIVRNGSKTPYKDTSASVNTFISYSENYVDQINASQLGAFYQSNVNTSSDSLVLAPVTSASISGNRVEILAAAFENINPYYVFTGDDGSVDVQLDKALQIQLSADQKLKIDVDNYIVNSSAIIELNSLEGELTLNAALVNNERYRVQSDLFYSSVTAAHLYGASRTELAAEVTVYSLPGIISSAGDVAINATQSVLNNTAYLEIFGNLTVDSPTISSLGYELSYVSFTSGPSLQRFAPATYFSHDSTDVSYLFFVINGGQQTQSSMSLVDGFNALTDGGSSDSVITIDAELDTLFSVNGSIAASSTTGWFSNNVPLHAFAEEGVEELYGASEHNCITAQSQAEEDNDGDFSHYSISGGSACDDNTAQEDRYYLDKSYSVEVIRESGELLVSISEDHLTVSDAGELEVVTQTTTVTDDLFDVLKAYYDSTVNWLASVYEEIKFW